LGVFGQLRRQKLEGDCPLKLCILGLVDDPHPPFSDLLEDLIMGYDLVHSSPFTALRSDILWPYSLKNGLEFKPRQGRNLLREFPWSFSKKNNKPFLSLIPVFIQKGF